MTSDLLRKYRIALVAGLLVLALGPPRAGRAAPPGFEVETVATGLEFPVTMAFAPDGRLFFNELANGRVRVILGGQLLAQPFAQIAVDIFGEKGLLGLAFHPDYASNYFVYVCFSTPGGGHEIGHFVDLAGIGAGYTPIVTGLPAQPGHNGGNIAFGPDGKLYYTIGDQLAPASAQDPLAVGGKIHRFNDDGSVPADNPFVGLGGLDSRYSIGLRNSFDLCWNLGLGRLYATENGSASNDELNLIVPGANYGWPAETCAGPSLAAPLVCWPDTIAPTGVAVYDRAEFGPAFLNDVFVGDFGDGNLWRVALDAGGTVVASVELFHVAGASITDVVVGLDGALYFSTINAIYRIVRTAAIGAPFVRGDVNADGAIDVSDSVTLFDHLLIGGGALSCESAADMNDDDVVNISDSAAILLYLFASGAGSGACVTDTSGGLDCFSAPACP